MVFLWLIHHSPYDFYLRSCGCLDENVLAASCGTRHRDLHRPGAGGWKMLHALWEIDTKWGPQDS